MQFLIVAIVALVCAVLVRKALLGRRTSPPKPERPPAAPGPFLNSAPPQPSPSPPRPTPPGPTPPTGVPARLIPRDPVLSAGCARKLEEVEQLTV